VDAAGALWGWGSNTHRLLGHADQLVVEEYPRRIRGVEDRRFSTIATGGTVACGVTQDGKLVCWGEEGLITTDHGIASEPCPAGFQGCPVPPLEIGAGTTWQQVAVGGEHACALDTAGQVACWGNGSRGQLGSTPLSTCPGMNGITLPCRITPTPVAGGLTFSSVVAANNSTCGITTAGGLRCWGAVIGNATTPLSVGLATGWVAVSLGSFVWDHACAVRTDGSWWCFGQSRVGGNTLSPRRITVGVAMTGVAAGADHACAWTATGEAWCFGNNMFGALGTGDVAEAFVGVPVRVGAPWRD
jgi:alpha-tubulin suppressor-like RCC1 family protein